MIAVPAESETTLAFRRRNSLHRLIAHRSDNDENDYKERDLACGVLSPFFFTMANFRAISIELVPTAREIRW